MTDLFPFVDSQKKFTVKTQAGYNLSCKIDLPLKCRNIVISKPEVAILCHGLYQTKDSRTIVASSVALLRDPPLLDATVRFDFHGEGESDGEEDWSIGGYDDEMKDLRDVIEYLRAYNCYVRLILGHSRAATVVQLYASTWGDVDIIVPVAGRLHMERGISTHINEEKMKLLQAGQKTEIIDQNGKHRKVTPDCIKKRISLDMRSALIKISKEPKIKAICYIHGNSDTTIPLSDAEESCDILRKIDESSKLDVSLRVIHNTGHDLGQSPNIEDYNLALRYLLITHPSSLQQT